MPPSTLSSIFFRNWYAAEGRQGRNLGLGKLACVHTIRYNSKPDYQEDFSLLMAIKKAWPKTVPPNAPIGIAMALRKRASGLAPGSLFSYFRRVSLIK